MNALHTENHLHSECKMERDAAYVWIPAVGYQHHGQSSQSVAAPAGALVPEGEKFLFHLPPHRAQVSTTTAPLEQVGIKQNAQGHLSTVNACCRWGSS